MPRDIIKDAELISKIIIDTETENRGDLLEEVSKELVVNTQFHTGKLFHIIAERYGINKPEATQCQKR